ncbi:MAG: PTS sugar transporter subunit IIA [Anaerolineaceae bacterium]|nr:PTS sugar transporter subunit IIA [Anaerolineaceae bacterium]
MIGVVIAAHGSLSTSLMESTSMILGDMEQVETVSLVIGDSLEGLIERVRDAVNAVNTGEGVVIFLDLFGGTPSNASALLTQEMDNVFAVTGVNFPMLAETFTMRPGVKSPQELVDIAVNAGKNSILDLVEEFRKFNQQ